MKMMRLVTFLLLAALWCSSVGAQDKTLLIKEKPIAAAKPFDKIALVIGVSDYVNHAKLPACHEDAIRFANFLRDQWKFPNGAVKVLLGEENAPLSQQANLSNLLIQTQSLVDNINEDSEVVFYYSGHGTHDDETGEDYMVPLEGSARILQTLVSLTKLQQKITAKNPRRAFLIIDACRDLRAGAKAGSKGTGVGQNAKTAAEPQIATLYSCQPMEVSQVGKTFPESVFTHYLLQGLQGDADAQALNGQVTFSSLKKFVRGNVSQYVRDNFNDATQNPTGFAAEGDMVLANPMSLPVTPLLIKPNLQPSPSPAIPVIAVAPPQNPAPATLNYPAFQRGNNRVFVFNTDRISKEFKSYKAALDNPGNRKPEDIEAQFTPQSDSALAQTVATWNAPVFRKNAVVYSRDETVEVTDPVLSLFNGSEAAKLNAPGAAVVATVNEDKLADNYTAYKKALDGITARATELDSKLPAREFLSATDGKEFDALMLKATLTSTEEKRLRDLATLGAGRRLEYLSLVNKNNRTAAEEQIVKTDLGYSKANSAALRALAEALLAKIKEEQDAVDTKYTDQANAVIAEVANKNATTLVVRKKALVWSRGNLDVTDLILSRLNGDGATTWNAPGTTVVAIVDEDKLADNYTAYKKALDGITARAKELDSKLEARKLLTAEIVKEFDALMLKATLTSTEEKRLRDLVTLGAGRHVEYLSLVNKNNRTAAEEQTFKTYDGYSKANDAALKELSNTLLAKINEEQDAVETKYTDQSNTVIAEVANRLNIDIVARKRALAYSPTQFDITDTVLQQLNQ